MNKVSLSLRRFPELVKCNADIQQISREEKYVHAERAEEILLI